MRSLVFAWLASSSVAAAGPAVIVEGTSQPPIDPVWRLDVAARGVGSVATGTEMRSGLAPTLAVRAEHRLGPLAVGGALALGLPAWAGQLDATLSADLEHEVTAQWRLALGADVGVSMFYFDAGVPDAVPADALVYWGPLARLRAQVVYLWRMPNGRAVGVVAGPQLAATRAHALEGEPVTATRLEPGVELGLTLRL